MLTFFAHPFPSSFSEEKNQNNNANNLVNLGQFDFQKCPRTPTPSLSLSESPIPKCVSTFKLLLTSPSPETSPKSFIVQDLLGTLMQLKWSLVLENAFDTPAPLASGKRFGDERDLRGETSDDAFTVFKDENELETPGAIQSVTKLYSTEFEEKVLIPAEEGLDEKNEIIFTDDSEDKKDMIMLVPSRSATENSSALLASSEYAGIRLVTNRVTTTTTTSSGDNDFVGLSILPTLLSFSLYIPPELNLNRYHKFYFLLSKKRLLACRTTPNSNNNKNDYDDDEKNNNNNKWFLATMTLRPRFSIIDSDTQFAAELAGSLSGALTMPVDGALVAATITQANGVLDVFMCSSSKVDTPLGFLESPFGMTIGKTKGKYLRGAVVGNVLIVFIFGALLVTAATVRYLFFNNDGANGNSEKLDSFWDALGMLTFPSSLLIFVSALTQGTIASSIGLLFIAYEERNRGQTSSSSSSTSSSFNKEEFIYNLTTDNNNGNNNNGEPSPSLTIFISILGLFVYIGTTILMGYVVLFRLNRLSRQVKFKEILVDERSTLPNLDVEFTQTVVNTVTKSSCQECKNEMILLSKKHNNSSNNKKKKAKNPLIRKTEQNKKHETFSLAAVVNSTTNTTSSSSNSKITATTTTTNSSSNVSSSEESSFNNINVNSRKISHRITWMEMIRHFVLRHLFFVGGIWFVSSMHKNKNNNNHNKNEIFNDRFFINRYGRFFAKNHSSAKWFPLLSLVVGICVGIVSGFQRYGSSVTCAQSLMFILAIVMAFSATAVWVMRPNLRSTANAYSIVAATFTFIMCVFGLIANLNDDTDSSVSQFSMGSVLVMLAAIKFFSTIMLFIDVAFLVSLKILPKIRGLKYVWIHFHEHRDDQDLLKNNKKKNSSSSKNNLEELLLGSPSTFQQEDVQILPKRNNNNRKYDKEEELVELEMKSRGGRGMNRNKNKNSSSNRKKDCWSLEEEEEGDGEKTKNENYYRHSLL